MDQDQATFASPFKHIAVSLSGGGVRAVGYHLGTLDYLERTGLLKEVHTLSSVSGGSLVAIGYALSLKKGETFQEYYDNLCEFLPEINTFEELLKILDNPSPSVASGSRTLITALATVYRQKYFKKYYDDPNFSIFSDHQPEIHLKELIFNATEFKTGTGFRFHVGVNGTGAGNTNVSIKEEFAKDIRMSDIMAASSCIPGGMEPMMFPQDFHWPGDPADRLKGMGGRPRCEEVQAQLEKSFGITNVPLMDGGIYDNQGIMSIILTQAITHRKSKISESESPADNEYKNDDEGEGELEPQRPRSWARWLLNSMEEASDVDNQKDMGDVDLFIVSDTPIRSDPMYSIPDRSQKTGIVARVRGLKLGTINIIGWIATILLVGSILFGAADISAPDELNEHLKDVFKLEIMSTSWQAIALVSAYYVSFFIQFVLVVVVVGLMYGFRKFVSRIAEKIIKVMPPMSQPIWSYTKSLTLGQLIDMVSLRASSMSALTAKIFMHRVRQLGYTLLYSHDHFERRVMDNNINDTLHAEDNTDIPDFLKDPSDAAESVMGTAATMETKLWVNQPENDYERDDLETLVASGHISTCFNIIEHLWEYHRDENGILKEQMVPLFEFAKADWIKLNKDPYWLLDKRESAGKDHGKLFWHSEKLKKRNLG